MCGATPTSSLAPTGSVSLVGRPGYLLYSSTPAMNEFDGTTDSVWRVVEVVEGLTDSMGLEVGPAPAAPATPTTGGVSPCGGSGGVLPVHCRHLPWIVRTLPSGDGEQRVGDWLVLPRRMT